MGPGELPHAGQNRQHLAFRTHLLRVRQFNAGRSVARRLLGDQVRTPRSYSEPLAANNCPKIELFAGRSFLQTATHRLLFGKIAERLQKSCNINLLCLL